MKKWIICFIMSVSVICVDAQIVTNCGGNPGTSQDGSHKWDVVKVELYKDYVLVHFEITALKPIRRLNIYDDNSYIQYGSNAYKERIGLVGCYMNDGIQYLGYNSSWGWSKIARGEKVNYVLCFGGRATAGNSIPAGVTDISICSIGVEVDGNNVSWRGKININNPRRNYTHYSSEYSIKQYLDVNNDGICGIYEIIGDDTGSKLACIKYKGNYTLIFMSDNLGRDWWKIGDIKATLFQSASGLLKADWYMSNKEINKDCYVTFDGVSMTVLFPSESDEKERERKYLKMYPTTPPSYINNQNERVSQEQQSAPQRKKQIPLLKKQKVKK